MKKNRVSFMPWLCLPVAIEIGLLLGVVFVHGAYASAQDEKLRLTADFGQIPARSLVGPLSAQLGAPVIYRGDPKLVLIVRWENLSLEEVNQDLLKRYRLQLWETEEDTFVLGPSEEKPAVVYRRRSPSPTPVVVIPKFSNDLDSDRIGFSLYGDPGISDSLDALATSTLRLAWASVRPRPRGHFAVTPPFWDENSWVTYVIRNHARRDNITALLLELFQRVTGLPIDHSATLDKLDVSKLLEDGGWFPRTIPEEQRRSVRKENWEWAILDLLMDLKPQGYQEVCYPFLVDAACTSAKGEAGRALHLLSVEPGGSLTDLQLRKLVNAAGAMFEPHKEVLLRVLGNSKSRQCLEYLGSDQAHSAFAECEDGLALAVLQLTYDLAGSRSDKTQILAKCLAEETDPQTSKRLLWAVQTAAMDKHTPLLPLVLAQRERLEEPLNRQLAQSYDEAIAALRAAEQEPRDTTQTAPTPNAGVPNQ